MVNQVRLEFMSYGLHLFLDRSSHINFLALACHNDQYVASFYRLHFEESHDFAIMNTTYIQQHRSVTLSGDFDVTGGFHQQGVFDAGKAHFLSSQLIKSVHGSVEDQPSNLDQFVLLIISIPLY